MREIEQIEHIEKKFQQVDLSRLSRVEKMHYSTMRQIEQID
jgi:hypothetical protein